MQNHPIRLAILNSHPIQYFDPLYQLIAQEKSITLTVYYCSQQGIKKYVDEGFKQEIAWDIPLAQEYKAIFLKNYRRRDEVKNFWSLMNLNIISEIKRKKFDAILLHGHAYFTNILTIIIAKLRGIPLLMLAETHLYLKRSPMKNVLHKFLITNLYKLFSGFLNIGTLNKQYYLTYGINKEKIFSFPYAVNNNFFIDKIKLSQQNLRDELGIFPETPIILFASKLISRKNPLDLLKAFEILQQQKIPAALLFVGSGPCEENLKKYVADKNLAHVFFLGFKNQNELPSYYAVADIFVLPSDNEPWGLVINEAMCAGLPIISTHTVGAAHDLVHHHLNGFCYESGDIKKLANYLLALIQDPQKRKQMGEKSFEIISSWSYEQGIQGLKQALRYVTTKDF